MSTLNGILFEFLGAEYILCECAILRVISFSEQTFVAVNEDQLKEAVLEMRGINGPILLEVKVCTGGRKNLGRPTRSPQENKEDFMHFLAIG